MRPMLEDLHRETWGRIGCVLAGMACCAGALVLLSVPAVPVALPAAKATIGFLLVVFA